MPRSFREADSRCFARWHGRRSNSDGITIIASVDPPDEVNEETESLGSLIDQRRVRARSKSSEAYRRRRSELELAATAVMARKGYHEMTLRDIAQEVGTDRASIYYYFADKEELLIDLVHGALVENAAEFATVAASSSSPREKVREFIRILMRQFDHHFPYLYIWVHLDLSKLEGLEQGRIERLAELSQQEFEFLESFIKEGVASGELTSTLPIGVVAQSLIGLVAWTHRWYEPGHGLSAERLADGLADIALLGLTNREDT
jgi:AcrR family transcriptional regulator